MSGIADTKPKTYGVRFAWSLVLLFTVVSIALNGAHAAMQWGGDEGSALSAVLLAVMAPVALLLATHLVVGLIQEWSRRRLWLVWLRGVVVATVTAIAGVAFVMSFSALMDMAVRLGMPDGHAWMPPAIIDAMIVAATLAVVVAESEMRLDREGAEHIAVLDTAPVAVQDTDDTVQDTVRDTPVMAAVTVSAETSVTAGHDWVDSPAGQSAVPVIPPVTEAGGAVSWPSEQGVDSLTVAPLDTDDTALNIARDGDDGCDNGVQDSVTVVVQDTDDTVADSAAEGVQAEADSTVQDPNDIVLDTVPDTALDLSSVTAQVIAEVGTTAAPEVVERALQLALDGLSARRVAEELAPGGPSRTPIAAWIRAAKDQPDYAAALGAEELVTV